MPSGDLPQAHSANTLAPHRRGVHACRLTVLADSLTKSAFPIDKSVQHATTGNFIMDVCPLLTMWVMAGGGARHGEEHSAVCLPGVAWQGCRFWARCIEQQRRLGLEIFVCQCGAHLCRALAATLAHVPCTRHP